MAPGAASARPEPSDPEPFRFCLNTGTLRDQNPPLTEEIEIAAKAGYDAIEPWVSEIQTYAEQGGSLPDLKKKIANLGLTVESAIGFAEWIGDEPWQSPKCAETWKHDMDLVAQIGGKRICAAPTGPAQPDLFKAAANYRRLLELGRNVGVTPQLELWGRSPSLARLGQVAAILAESGDRDACATLDVFHIYTGGSPFAGLRSFNGDSLHVFHMNDYPADPPRDRIGDQHRVYPGDGIAPLKDILDDLRAIGFRGFLSLELFNHEYGRQDPLAVATTGLDKMRAVVDR